MKVSLIMLEAKNRTNFQTKRKRRHSSYATQAHHKPQILYEKSALVVHTPLGFDFITLLAFRGGDSSSD